MGTLSILALTIFILWLLPILVGLVDVWITELSVTKSLQQSHVVEYEHIKTVYMNKPAVSVTMTKPKWFIGEWGINKPSPAEQLIINELQKYNIHWEREVSFEGLMSDKKGYMRYDFYLPDHNTCIEYQGKDFHIFPERRNADFTKQQFCRDNSIELIIYESVDYYKLNSRIKELMAKLGINEK